MASHSRYRRLKVQEVLGKDRAHVPLRLPDRSMNRMTHYCVASAGAQLARQVWAGALMILPLWRAIPTLSMWALRPAAYGSRSTMARRGSQSLTLIRLRL